MTFFTLSGQGSTRSQKLIHYLNQILSGKQTVRTSSNAKLLLEALCDQKDQTACIERLVTHPESLPSLQLSFRLDLSTDFVNGPASDFIRYLQDPALGQLCNGQFLRQIVELIVEPSTFWDVLLRAHAAGTLQPRSSQCFAWLLYQLLSTPTEPQQGHLLTARNITEKRSFLDSSSVEVRVLGQKIQQALLCLASPGTDKAGFGPAGRHDNDLVDFRQISILPTPDELSSGESPFLRRAAEIGESKADERVATHLDNQFRLLREDMLGELRGDLQIARGLKKGRHRSHIISNLRLAGVECGSITRRKPCGLRFYCDLPQLSTLKTLDRKAYLNANKSFLKHQSVACLLAGEDVVAFASIDRDEELLANESPIVLLHFPAESALTKTLLITKLLPKDKALHLVQVDTPLFAYQPVLRRLQEKHCLQLSEEILFLKQMEPSESSSGNLTNVVEQIENNPAQDFQHLLRTDKPIFLDTSQVESLLATLKQRLSLILGPPGTGKSFIGALLAKLLCDNTKWTILVICYTNHALDQFLADLLDIGIPASNIVRLGSKSTPKTQYLTLKEQASRSSHRLSRTSWDVITKLKDDATTAESQLKTSISGFKIQPVGSLDILEYLEFSEDTFYEAFSIPESTDGMKLVGKKGKAVGEDYLVNQWMNGQDAGVFLNAIADNNQHVWNIATPTRLELVAGWKRAILQDRVSDIANSAKLYDKCQSQLQDMFNEPKAATIRQMRVVGCTTTGAAMYVRELQASSPDVVLVEEAGEVLESHVLTAMGAETKRLILIGDHKQLRPKINNYELTVEKDDGYELNRSLFERLVLGGLPHSTLTQQHRMAPAISSFVRRLTYPHLVDADDTKNRPPLRGFRDSVVFFNHEHLEKESGRVGDSRDQNSKTSRQNEFEVAMILKCVRYLAQQGYGTDSIVILTPYLAQLFCLRDTLSKDHDPILNDLDSYDLVRAGLIPAGSAKISKRQIKISTIDNYQGEESDIVIATLTRSNKSGDIGFMAAPERLNVLLSRARNALIMIGNAKTFASSRKGKDTWTPFLDFMKKDGHIYDGFPVKCERHPSAAAMLRNESDFDLQCPDGGCSRPCDTKLSCGVHDCPQKCHQLVDHSKMACTSPLESQCPRGHRLRWQCSDGGPKLCWKCAMQDAASEKKAKRDQQLDASRELRRQQYADQLARLDDEIYQQRQNLKHASYEKDMEQTLHQKQKELETAKNLVNRTKNRPERSQLPRHQPDDTSRTRDQPKSSRSGKDSEDGLQLPCLQISTAQAEWQHQKEFENVQDDTMDSLMDMIGLEAVKQKFLGIKAKVDTAIRQNTNLKNERFGVALLGNPGTGKTTVARLYAKLLTSFGVLPGDAFIETSGAKLANEGVSGAKKQVEKLLEAGGGALFIDEAYQLVASHNYGGSQVLDFLLAEMENQMGKIVFILAGYNKQMEAFFQHNPGLTSRIPHHLQFSDYEDAELLRILSQLIDKRYDSRMRIQNGRSGLYMRIASRRVGRGRGREGFGNARAMQNAFQIITDRQAERLRQERRQTPDTDDFLLTREDLIGPEPSQALGRNAAWTKLRALVGLGAVKDSVHSLLELIQTNYQRELEEKPLVKCSLNRVFLGSPGTGKTSVAKLYGEILASIGLLSNGEVILKNPSDFVGSALGQSESNTKAILASTLGKVLIIDEAYMLYRGRGESGGQNDPYTTAVIDTIVAEVQSVAGDDRCVLLLGYRDQMESMFQNVNPGLSRRFPLESAFEFEDFTDLELAEIVDMKLQQQGFSADESAKKVAMEVLSRARNRPNFGNAGEVDILLDRAKTIHQRRISVKKTKNVDGLDAEDFDEDFNRGAAAATNCRKLFEDVVGCEEVISKLEGYQSVAQRMRELNQDPTDQIPFNFLFKGPPGTGKTTTARKMGKVFYDMGFLSAGRVEECSATDLIGQYIGQTGPKVQQMLDKSLGRVLFIDEAYRLGESAFGVEAINELVASLTKPRYESKLITILAGYDADIDRLISINPGLTSRFPEEIQFKNMSPDHSLILLEQSLMRKKVDTTVLQQSTPLRLQILTLLGDLASTPAWGNARDIQSLAKSIFGTLLKSTKNPKGLVLTCDMMASINEMLSERRRRASNAGIGKTIPSGDAIPLGQEPRLRSERRSVQNVCIDSKVTEEAPNILMEDVASTATPATRDSGVSDAAWQQLQDDIRAADNLERRESEVVARHEAVVEEATASEELLSKVVEKNSTSQKSHESQELDEQRRKHEQDRLDREAARRRREEVLAELERARKAFEERKRKEAKAQEKLKAMGVCCAGYRWIKQASGYQCAGGSHFVSNVQLEL